jgi:putative protease
VRNVVAAFRKAVDAVLAGDNPEIAGLLALTEGHRETQGAFQGKTWR